MNRYIEGVPDQTSNTFETTQKTEDAREIVQNTTFAEARKTLEETGNLEEQVQYIKKHYKEVLSGAEFMTEKDWECFTFIHLYSEELATHSIETYQLVRTKIENITFKGETISEIIKKEGASLDEFYRACLLHDIGKTAIPESVLNYTFGPGDWHALFWIACKDSMKKWVQQNLGSGDDANLEEFSIFKTIHDYQENPVVNIPVKSYLPRSELEKLEKRGIATDFTLRQILELHEKASEEILKEEELFTEASIAGQHHNYANEEYRFPISSKVLGINADLADLLRLADEEQALLSERPYKEAFTHVAAYDILTRDAEKGAISKELTALWIHHELERGLKAESVEDEKKLVSVRAFAQKYLLQ